MTPCIDRYHLDCVVNVSVLQRNSPEAMLRDALWLERVPPKAQIHLFLEASEETALRRKNDIQSIRYLRERKHRYWQLAPHYRFDAVDAGRPVENVVYEVRRRMAPLLAETASPVR